jgi:hypothetical protein
MIESPETLENGDFEKNDTELAENLTFRGDQSHAADS